MPKADSDIAKGDAVDDRIDGGVAASKSAPSASQIRPTRVLRVLGFFALFLPYCALLSWWSITEHCDLHIHSEVVSSSPLIMLFYRRQAPRPTDIAERSCYRAAAVLRRTGPGIH